MPPGWTSSSVLTVTWTCLHRCLRWVPSQRGFPRIPRQRAAGADDRHQVQMTPTTVLSSSFCESTYQIDQRGQPPLCLHFQLCLQISLWCYCFPFATAFFASWSCPWLWPSIMPFVTLLILFSLCPFRFLQTHSLHQFLQRHCLPVHVIAFFMTGLQDLSFYRTEHVPSRPMWQINPLRTHATANSTAIHTMFLHQITVYTHAHTHKNACKCFLRRRWDQRALLTYTILWFCHLFASKVIKTRTGNSTAHLTAYSSGLLPALL